MTSNYLKPPELWRNEISDWGTAMSAMHLSDQTIIARSYHLRRLSQSFASSSPWAVTDAELLTWATAHKWSRETARSFRNSFRRFWEWGVATHRTERNIAVILPSVRPLPAQPRPAQHSTVAAAISQADTRVSLMIRLANELGMRRGEVAKVHPEHDLVKDPAGWSLLVHGKGSRNRVLPLPEDLAETLLAAPEGFLFPGPTQGHLSPHWVGTLVSRALADGTTMHQLRHLCATEVHDQTHDIRLVQVLLGHASLATTQRYVAVDDAKMREALSVRSRLWNM